MNSQWLALQLAQWAQWIECCIQSSQRSGFDSWSCLIFFRLSFNRLGCSFYREDHVHFLISIRGSNMIHFIYIIILIYFNSTIGYINNTQWLALQMAWFAQWIHIWVRFDPTIVTIKQSLIVSQILSCPVVLSYLVLLESINKLFARCR